MSQDILLRGIVVVLAVLLYLNHQVHGKRFPKASTVKGLGEVILVFAACLWTMSLGAYVLGLRWDALQLPLPSWSRWVGVAGMFVCLPLSTWVYRTLGAQFSTRLQLREGHHLIVSGPYRFIRHPMYATFFLCAFSAAFISADLLVCTMGAAVSAAMLARIGKEERMLQERFGERYAAYKNTTGKVFPKLFA